MTLVSRRERGRGGRGQVEEEGMEVGDRSQL